ncbi:MAG: autotransporter-associated beta strand repeat-containing protein [Verrucomicrobia bacterium]|nr:autotransporter-associated beta strand repeat-containing protein [Verrucomicrobiota bacterium]
MPSGTEDIFFNPASGLSLTTSNDLSAGTFTANSITMNSTFGASALTITGSAFTLSGSLSNLHSSKTFNLGNTTVDIGTITLGNSITITANATSNINVYGSFADDSSSRGITKSGNGTLTFFRQNTYTGTTSINRGTLVLNSSTGDAIYDSGVITLANTANVTLQISASETIGSLRGGGTTGGNVTIDASRTLTVAETGDQTFSGRIIGSGSLTKTGSGTMTLNGTNSFSGTATISGGTLAISGGSAISDSGAVTLADSSGVRLNVLGSETIGPLSGGGGTGGEIAISASQTLTVNQTSSQTFLGVISGSGGFTKNGSAVLTVAGSNTYSGVTTLNSGTLSFNTIANGGSVSGIGQSSSAASNLVLNGGELEYTGASATTNRGFTVGSGGAAVDVNNAAATLRFTGGISGTGILTKSGGGTLEFVGNSVAGAVTVSSGSLAGNASFGGMVTLNNSANLVPGNGVGGFGTITAGAGLTLNSGGTVRMDLSNSSGSSDSISVTGALTYGGALALSISGEISGVSESSPNTYNLFAGSPSRSGNFASVTVAGSYDGSFSLVSANTWQRNTGDGTLWTFSQSTGTLTVIPEPSTWALFSFGVGFVLWHVRRRQLPKGRRTCLPDAP